MADLWTEAFEVNFKDRTQRVFLHNDSAVGICFVRSDSIARRVNKFRVSFAGLLWPTPHCCCPVDLLSDISIFVVSL